MAHDVFISYAVEDKPAADATCALLEGSRVRCWIAPRDILAGQDYAAEIMRAISSARVLVLVFSACANASPHVRREVERAVNRGLVIVPVRIEDATPSDALEYLTAGAHWLDALSHPLEAHLRRLAETVALIIERLGPAGPPTVPQPGVGVRPTGPPPPPPPGPSPGLGPAPAGRAASGPGPPVAAPVGAPPPFAPGPALQPRPGSPPIAAGRRAPPVAVLAVVAACCWVASGLVLLIDVITSFGLASYRSYAILGQVGAALLVVVAARARDRVFATGLVVGAAALLAPRAVAYLGGSLSGGAWFDLAGSLAVGGAAVLAVRAYTGGWRTQRLRLVPELLGIAGIALVYAGSVVGRNIGWLVATTAAAVGCVVLVVRGPTRMLRGMLAGIAAAGLADLVTYIESPSSQPGFWLLTLVGIGVAGAAAVATRRDAPGPLRATRRSIPPPR